MTSLDMSAAVPIGARLAFKTDQRVVERVDRRGCLQSNSPSFHRRGHQRDDRRDDRREHRRARCVAAWRLLGASTLLLLALAGCGGNGGWGLGTGSDGGNTVTGPVPFGPAASLGVNTGNAARNRIGATVVATIGSDGVLRVAWSQTGLALADGTTRTAADVAIREYSTSASAWGSAIPIGVSAGSAGSADRVDDTITDLAAARGGAPIGSVNASSSWVWRRSPVAAGPGRLIGAQVASGTVQVADLPPVSAGTQAADLVMASNAAGTIAAAWVEQGATRSRVIVSLRSGASGWAPAFALQTVDADGRRPSIAVDPNGRVLVLWTEGVAGATAIRSRLFRNGFWEPPTTPNGPAGDADNAQVIATGAESFLAVWLANVSGSVASSTRSLHEGRWNGSAWSLATPAIETLADPIADLTLAAAPNGGGLAMWLQADQLWFQRYAATTQAWAASAVALPGTRASGARGPRVAVSDSGRAVAVWSQPASNGAGDVVYAALDAGGGNFSSPVSVRSGTAAATSPSIAVFGSNALVAWQQVLTTQDNPEIQARVYVAR